MTFAAELTTQNEGMLEFTFTYLLKRSNRCFFLAIQNIKEASTQYIMHLVHIHSIYQNQKGEARLYI